MTAQELASAVAVIVCILILALGCGYAWGSADTMTKHKDTWCQARLDYATPFKGTFAE